MKEEIENWVRESENKIQYKEIKIGERKKERKRERGIGIERDT